MKKLMITIVVLACVLVLGNQYAFAYDFPSTNDENRTNGHPHVNQVSVDVGEVTLDFVNTTNSLAFFEYRIDGVVLTSGASHPVVIGDFIYPGVCVDNRVSPACPPQSSLITRTFTAVEKVEVRLALGGERDWDFDWVTFNVLPVPVPKGFYLSTESTGVVDGVGYSPEDILLYDPDGDVWSKFFDGSDNELNAAKHNINAIHVGNTAAPDDIYMAFQKKKINVPGIGNVKGHDVVHFDGSDFSLFFEGADVSLAAAGERIDALAVLDGSYSPIGGSCQAYLLISTSAAGKVPAFGGGVLKFRGEDILGFCMTNSGDATAGFWHLFLDGSDLGMPQNFTSSISADLDNDRIFFTTRDVFNVPPASGGHSMVYVYNLATNEFSGPIFDATVDLTGKVDGLDIALGPP
jgi:hypothetical protein